MPDTDDRSAALWEKIEKLSKELSSQKAENEKLLEMIKHRPPPVAGGKENDRAAAPVATEKPAGAGKSDQDQSSMRDQSSSPVIAVLVIACNRPNAITNHLDQLLK